MSDFTDHVRAELELLDLHDDASGQDGLRLAPAADPCTAAPQVEAAIPASSDAVALRAERDESLACLSSLLRAYPRFVSDYSTDMQQQALRAARQLLERHGVANAAYEARRLGSPAVRNTGGEK